MADEEKTIAERHKGEQKELNAQIQALKHGIPKGDKKKKKQVTAEIAQLQAELDQRQEEELANDSAQQPATTEKEGLCEETKQLNLNDTNGDANTKKPSKAQKRREKKEQEERERQKRLLEGEKESENHVRNIEISAFAKIMEKHQLKIQEVQPDGNCMYNSIIAQNAQGSLSDLRSRTAEFMRSHRDDFLPFTSNPNTGDMLNQEEYDVYCDDIQQTNAWGGHLELRAISQLHQQRVEVFQATAPTLIIGEEFDGKPIRLSYHRHQYGLGEHYNALVPAAPS